MNDFQDLEFSRHLARQAMDRMTSLDICPTPENFNLWFRYCAGREPDLCRALDQLVEAGVPLSEARLAKLHERFSRQHSLEEAVREVGGRMQTELARMLTSVMDASSSSTDYGTTLQLASEHLKETAPPSPVPTVPPVPTVIDTLVTATRQMQARTRSLESELNGSSQQIEDLRHALSQIQQETLTDSLTRLANRRAFDQALPMAMDEADETGAPLCLVMADLDNFKRINDTFGHLTGDQILRLAAKCLSTGLGENELAARFGGEEFALILPGHTPQTAWDRADQIRISLEKKKVTKRSTGEDIGQVTMSLGVTGLMPRDTAESLIERADRHLYEAKRAGRNRIVSDAIDQPADLPHAQMRTA